MLRFLRLSALAACMTACLPSQQAACLAGEQEPVPRSLLEPNSYTILRTTPNVAPKQDLTGRFALSQQIRDVEFLVQLKQPLRTVTKWSVTLDRESAPIRAQLLASSVSAEAGFRLLRDEIVPANGQSIEMDFDDSAAIWLLIRLEAVKSDLPIAISQISVRGYDGAPKTRYRFDESPAAALDVITSLQNGSSPIKLSADERSMFADASDGRFDTWTFAEAALLASGVAKKSRRDSYLKQIDAIERSARRIADTDDSVSDFAKADKLLRWMHSDQGPFSDGYVAQQTDVSTILDDSTFNCVSSATLYNIIGGRLGLDLRAIEVPDHAFSILYDGTRHADVETTNKLGFNPGRHSQIREQLEQQTGFRYIPDKHRDLRREINSVQLVAIIYYNHGVTHSHDKRHREALVDYFRAMSMDSEFNSAVKNALAAMVSWGNELSAKSDFRSAASVIETGLELARSDAALNHNRRVVYSQWARHLAESGKTDEAIAVLKKARRQMPDEQFVSLQAWVFIQEAETHIIAGQWRDALAVTERGQTVVDSEAIAELLRWKAGCFLRWGNDALKREKHEESVNAVVEGLELFRGDRRLANNLAYTVQEWASHLSATQGSEAARTKLFAMQRRFPDHQGVHEVAADFARKCFIELRDARRFEEALQCIEENAPLFADQRDSEKLFRNAYDAWARQFMSKRDWSRAVDIYARGLAQLPNERLFKQNAVYCIQEWTTDSNAKVGIDKTRVILVEQRERFPELDGVQNVVDRWARTAVEEHVQRGEFEKGWERLAREQELMTERDWTNSSRRLIDHWAADFHEQEKWEQALDVYDIGMKRLANDGHIRRNASATWHAWARPSLNAKRWEDAIRIYELASKRMPDEGSLKQNLRYCRKQAEKAAEKRNRSRH